MRHRRRRPELPRLGAEVVLVEAADGVGQHVVLRPHPRLSPHDIYLCYELGAVLEDDRLQHAAGFVRRRRVLLSRVVAVRKRRRPRRDRVEARQRRVAGYPLLHVDVKSPMVPSPPVEDVVAGASAVRAVLQHRCPEAVAAGGVVGVLEEARVARRREAIPREERDAVVALQQSTLPELKISSHSSADAYPLPPSALGLSKRREGARQVRASCGAVLRRVNESAHERQEIASAHRALVDALVERLEV